MSEIAAMAPAEKSVPVDVKSSPKNTSSNGNATNAEGQESDKTVRCCGLSWCVMTTGLQECSACRTIAYCGKDHQTQHFKEGHKLVCPGRTKGAPLKFNECVEKATRYYDGKMWVAALPYYAAMLELTERTIGIFHPQCATILSALADCYENQDRLEEYIQCLSRIIVIREMLHDGSLETSKGMFNLTGRLAEAYARSGRMDLAKEVMQKTENQATEVFGEHSFERGRAVMSLATVLEMSGEHNEAEDTFKRAIAISGYGDTKEPAQMVVASNCYYNLGIVLTERERFAEAVPFLEKALDFKIRGRMAPNHPDLMENKAKLAEVKAKV